MSTLFDRISADLVTARKAKVKAAADSLRTLKGEISPSGTEAALTDQQIIKVITKFIKGLNETMAAKVKLERNVEAELYEIDLLKRYLPTPLTDEQLKVVIRKYVAENDLTTMKEMGKVMGYLKSDFADRYDGKAAMVLVKSTLREKIKADKKYAGALDDLVSDIGKSVDPNKMVSKSFDAKAAMASTQVADQVDPTDVNRIILPFER